ncbi:U2 small nuclear ribonucleoprotein A' [Geodia barretti]|uniref:U2 small nuclear ribonucleoprotein A n=1 Tax=Geodia barretti TaxID=519541 RepID=A0AA35WNX4_GEOBA|nr:U2 small nuclear ribonucleoprotein A' [Geodia barretti]
MTGLSCVNVGNKIAVIENLGATLDQFDTIDLSDNEIKKLEGFPLLKRLKSILLSNNKICRVADGLEQCLPKLETLVLTNNNLDKLEDLEQLATVTTLQYLCLLRNQVTHRPNYRLYVIHKIPQLRVLDFKRIRQKEREQAKRAYGEKKPAEPRKSKTFVPGATQKTLPPPPPQPSGPSPREVARIREAIANAKSLDEVQQLEAMLKAGQIPGDVVTSNHHGGTHSQARGGGYEMEEEEVEG